MNRNFKRISVASLVVAMVGCASTPVGPSLTVMPAPGKPFDVFQQDDKECRAYAQGSLDKTADEAAALSTAKTAVVGAALGALAGAVAGGGSHKTAGTGAAVGMVGGAAVGASQGNDTGKEIQRRYDIAYQQCMYSKGNQVPGYSIQKSPSPVPPVMAPSTPADKKK
jgi:hypothetical protein